MHTNAHVHAGAYYILGNVDPRFRSKIHSIQLLILAKYSSVAEFGIDRILEPAVKDIEKLELVSMIMYKGFCSYYIHAFFLADRGSLCNRWKHNFFVEQSPLCQQTILPVLLSEGSSRVHLHFDIAATA